jgi:hypothetical protein
MNSARGREHSAVVWLEDEKEQDLLENLTFSSQNAESVDGIHHVSHRRIIFPESIEKQNILFQFSEIFPNEKEMKLIEILEDCNWSMDRAVISLLDQNQSSLATSTSPMPNHDSQQEQQHQQSQSQQVHEQEVAPVMIPIPQFHSRGRAKKDSLPIGFLEIPRVRTILVSSSPHWTRPLPEGHLEYKVFFYRKGRSLDLNVKLLNQTVQVFGLYPSPYGGPGLSELAGIQVGDVLFGINHEYFNREITLKQITTVLSSCGPYLCLHFFRLKQPNTSFLTIMNGQLRRTGQLRRIHPCALAVIDQGLLQVDDVEAFCEDLSRLKARIFSWSSGVLISRQRIADLILTGGGAHDDTSREETGGGGGSGERRHSKSEYSLKRRLLRSSPSLNNSSHSSSHQSKSSTNPMVSEITKNWYRDIELSTVNLQPALCMRILDTRKVSDHTEYRIWVEDISTGLEWYVRRRYKEFYKLREVHNTSFSIDLSLCVSLSLSLCLCLSLSLSLCLSLSLSVSLSLSLSLSLSDLDLNLDKIFSHSFSCSNKNRCCWFKCRDCSRETTPP